MTVKELSRLYWLKREIDADQKRLYDLDHEINVDEKRLALLEEEVASLSAQAFDSMPKTPSKTGSRVEEDAIALAALKEHIQRKKQAREAIMRVIREKQALCIEERHRLEAYIAGIPESAVRLIITYRFVDGLTWAQVSESLGMRTTEDSVKKMCYRFLKQENGKKIDP